MLKNFFFGKRGRLTAISAFLSFSVAAASLAVPAYAETRESSGWHRSELSAGEWEIGGDEAAEAVASAPTAGETGEGVFYEEEHMLPTLPEDRPLSESYDDFFDALASEKGEDDSFYTPYADVGNYLQKINKKYIKSSRTYIALTASEQAAMNAAAREILSGVNPSWDDLDKLLYVHDLLVSTRSYDTTYTKYSAYENLVEKTSVCQGYAEAIWYLMYMLDIDCKIVSSDMLNHAWNLVKINGKWYQLDATWNDPIPDTPGNSRHTYFLLSDNALSTVGDGDHAAPDMRLRFEGNASAAGYATDTTYDDWFWKDCRSPIVLDGNYYYLSVNKEGICRIDKSNQKTLLVDLSNVWWPVIGKNGYSWVGTFSGVGLNENTLYYNDATHVYACDRNGNGARVIYELPASEAQSVNIYGLNFRDGTIILTLADKPGSASISMQREIRAPVFVALPTLNAAPRSKQVALSWSAVSGAKKYRVFTYLNERFTQIGETTATSFTVPDLINGTKYGFLVLASDGSSWSSYTVSDVVYATPMRVDTPVITVNAGSNQADVAWEAVSGAKKYRVFTYLDGKYTQRGETSATSFTVKDLATGTKYGFLVLANDGSEWSAYTLNDVVFATPSRIGLPAITTAAGNNQVTVTWGAVGGAKKYRIFTYQNGKYTQRGETSGTSFTVKNLSGGTTYGFLVLANDGSDWSPYTANDVVYAIPSGIGLPAIATEAGNNQVTVTWGAVSGAKKYRIFTYQNGKYTQRGETTGTSFVVKNLSGGTTYGFLVLANDGSDWSPYTANDVVYAIPSGIGLPAIATEAGNNQVTVTWGAVGGAKKYRIFTYQNGKYTQRGETSGTSFVVKNLSGGTQYGFLVLANDGSAWSPYTVNDVVYAIPSGIALPAIKTAAGKNQVTVTWSAVSGAKKYRIFTYQNGKYTQRGETSGTSFVVKNLSGGTSYGFLVLANDGSAWSPYTVNDVVYATPSK